MTIKLPVSAELVSGFGVRIKPVNNKDWALFQRFFATKKNREAYNKKESHPIVTFELPYQKRTYSQIPERMAVGYDYISGTGRALT
jgi:hypothetical protein